MRIDCVTFVLLIVVCVCLASPWIAVDYPDPKKTPEKCLGKMSGDSLWLCDPDSVLGADAAGLLTEIQDVNSRADCVCNCSSNPDKGYVVGVAVVEGVSGNNEDPTATFDLFGQTVRESWFSIRACDDSVLLLFVKNNSQIHVTLGSRINELLPAHTLDDIDKEIEPLLQGSQFTKAIGTALQNLDLAISENVGAYGSGTPANSMTTEEPEPANNLVYGILGVIAIMSILIFHYWIKY